MTASAEALPRLSRQSAEFGSGSSATARGRHGLLRAFFCALAVVALAAHVHGEEAVDCDSLPESRRALCVMVQVCATVADKTQRQECFRAAAASLGDDGADAAGEHAEVTSDDEAVEGHPEVAIEEAPTMDAAPALETEVVEAAVEDVPARAPDPPTPAVTAPVEAAVEAATAASEPRRSRVARAFRELIAAQRATDAPTLPRRFTAQVTGHHDLVRDRQLVVLDDALLFEGDRAASSRISVGDEVEVVKASSLRGRRYQITGPTKRPFDALRIRCERHELSVDNRRKCERMIGD